MMISSDHATYFSVALFCIGLAGVLTRKNLIIIFVSVELMLNAANLNFVAMSRRAMVGSTMPSIGDSTALFVILIAACEVAIGLGLLIGLYRHAPSLAVEDVAELKE